MARHTTLILPAAKSGWEIWSCAGGGCTLRSVEEDPAKAVYGKGEILAALPAKLCRTLAFQAPVHDRRLARRLAYAQLEKRGLSAGSPERTSFDCRLLDLGKGRKAVSVDVLVADVFQHPPPSGLSGILPYAGLFPPAPGKPVILEEQGRLVFCVGAEGRLLYSQILSSARRRGNGLAGEIRVTILTLRQQGLIPEPSGLELRGDFSEEEARVLSAALGLPVEVKPRPEPDARALPKSGTVVSLLPAAARAALRKRRLRMLRALAGAAVAAVLLLWWGSAQAKLAALEKEAARLEATVQENTAAEGPSPGRAARERWMALRMALDPRRYPLVHLNALTRCMGEGGVVLARFESKTSELSARGAARTPADAYAFFNAVNADRELGVFSWSMAQPTITKDGAAIFEIKGKMR